MRIVLKKTSKNFLFSFSFSTIMSFLPLETIMNIVNFVEYDISTLRSLSLINRTWCQVSIPLIWKNVFNPDVSVGNRYKIICIILSYLDNDTKSILRINDERI